MKSATVLASAGGWQERKVKEAIHIRKQARKRELMNKDSGWYLSDNWQCVLQLCDLIGSVNDDVAAYVYERIYSSFVCLYQFCHILMKGQTNGRNVESLYVCSNA